MGININGVLNINTIGASTIKRELPPPPPTFNFSITNDVYPVVVITGISGFTLTGSTGTPAGIISFGFTYTVDYSNGYTSIYFTLYQNGNTIFYTPTQTTIGSTVYATYPSLLVAKDDTILITIFTSD
jgi:hypothetical protein